MILKSLWENRPVPITPRETQDIAQAYPQNEGLDFLRLFSPGEPETQSPNVLSDPREIEKRYWNLCYNLVTVPFAV